MRKILRIGLFLCAAAAAAPSVARACDDESPGPEGVVRERPATAPARVRARLEDPPARFDQYRGASAIGRDYGLFVMVLWLPVAVVGWGVQREARRRGRRAT